MINLIFGLWYGEPHAEGTVSEIFLRPKAVVDRQAVVERIETLLHDASPSAEDTVRSEDEILRDAIGEIVRTRAERRKP